MEIDAYLDEIDRLWPRAGEPPARELVDLCSQGVEEHPESSTLWYDLGIIMERCDEAYAFTADDSRRCFENAVKCDPNNAEAYQELGYVLDVYFSDYAGAEQAFNKAIQLGAERESYFGRARSLAQAGRTEDAIKSLSQDACPFHDDLDIQKLRTEILDGSWFSELNEENS
jgi:tetratricopeptide (TPR) repeat protein